MKKEIKDVKECRKSKSKIVLSVFKNSIFKTAQRLPRACFSDHFYSSKISDILSHIRIISKCERNSDILSHNQTISPNEIVVVFAVPGHLKLPDQQRCVQFDTSVTNLKN